MMSGHSENMAMLRAELTEKLVIVRKAAAEEHEDPRGLFNDVQGLVVRLDAVGEHVPDELREFLAELEGEIVEDFYDNLPV